MRWWHRSLCLLQHPQAHLLDAVCLPQPWCDPLQTPTVPFPWRERTITLLIMALVFASSLLWYIII